MTILDVFGGGEQLLRENAALKARLAEAVAFIGSRSWISKWPNAHRVCLGCDASVMDAHAPDCKLYKILQENG